MSLVRLVLAAAVLLASMGCSGNGGRVDIMTADPVGKALDISIAACNPTNLVVTVVRESASAVELRATVDDFAKGDDCASGRQVDLEAPLGDRQVYDADTKQPVPRSSG